MNTPGPDRISYEFIKQLPREFKIRILELFNVIWRTGTYADQWLQAIVIPILKAGKDSHIASNYRPISLTGCLSKLLERMINNRLLWLLETLHVLSPFQMGFRKHRSTCDQLALLENAIQNSFARREHIVAVTFDLEKAYDTTWRRGILKTLHLWGLRGHLPLFIKRFLSIRQFAVRINNTKSSQIILDNGVPQESTLSATLFSVAVNALISEVTNPVLGSIYVDDLVMFYSAKSMEQIEEEAIQQNINRVVGIKSKNHRPHASIFVA